MLTFRVTYPADAVLVSRVIADETGLDPGVIVKTLPVLPLTVLIRADADRPTLVFMVVGFAESKRIGPETVRVTTCEADAPAASVTVRVSK